MAVAVTIPSRLRFYFSFCLSFQAIYQKYKTREFLRVCYKIRSSYFDVNFFNKNKPHEFLSRGSIKAYVATKQIKKCLSFLKTEVYRKFKYVLIKNILLYPLNKYLNGESRINES